MNIHAGNDADNCDARADSKEVQGTTPLSTLAPSTSALRADVRVTRWLIQQPSADWKTRLQSPHADTEVEETNGTSARDSPRRITRKEY